MNQLLNLQTKIVTCLVDKPETIGLYKLPSVEPIVITVSTYISDTHSSFFKTTIDPSSTTTLTFNSRLQLI